MRITNYSWHVWSSYLRHGNIPQQKCLCPSSFCNRKVSIFYSSFITCQLLRSVMKRATVSFSQHFWLSHKNAQILLCQKRKLSWRHCKHMYNLVPLKKLAEYSSFKITLGWVVLILVDLGRVGFGLSCTRKKASDVSWPYHFSKADNPPAMRSCWPATIISMTFECVGRLKNEFWCLTILVHRHLPPLGPIADIVPGFPRPSCSIPHGRSLPSTATLSTSSHSRC